MTKIEIFLCIKEKQISFLSIPRSDIERLAVSPFRWIRYTMFAICGARGDLLTAPNGPAVNYEDTEIANEQNQYYYRPSGDCVFVDHEGLNDRVTTITSQRTSDFRGNVIQRDGTACVITGMEQVGCDAAHLIPHSKGDEYIKEVIRLRAPEGDSVPQIDMTENGILLRKDVHALLARGEVALIKTPNYGLRPEDIKRFNRGGERETYITLQWIVMPEDVDPKFGIGLQLFQKARIAPPPSLAFNALQNVDALFAGTGEPLPSTVILDYVYGISAFKAWDSKRGDGFDQMKAYRIEHYAQIPPPPPPSLSDDDDVPSEPDDPNDADYKPPNSRGHRSTRRSGLEETMDELNMILMYISGITPEMAAERNQKKIEQEEQAAQEASRSKVMEWRKHVVC